MSDFADNVKSAALAHVEAAGSSATTCTVLDAVPLGSETMSSTGNRLMAFNLSFDQIHNITAFKLRCFSSHGESFAILGGDKLVDASAGSSFDCSRESTTVLRVVGRYPMPVIRIITCFRRPIYRPQTSRRRRCSPPPAPSTRIRSRRTFLVSSRSTPSKFISQARPNPNTPSS